MKRNSRISCLVAGLVILALVAQAVPFVTPGMMKRNGLTDEQYELLWQQGKKPQIDTATARDWIFRASRYRNVVDWLEELGATNDFAKLAHKLQGENFDLVSTNDTLRSNISALWQRINGLELDVIKSKWDYDAATNYAASVEATLGAATNRLAELDVAYVVATNRADAAELAVERFMEFRDYLEEQRDSAKLESTKKLYQALIDRMDGDEE